MSERWRLTIIHCPANQRFRVSAENIDPCRYTWELVQGNLVVWKGTSAFDWTAALRARLAKMWLCHRARREAKPKRARTVDL